MSIRDTSLDLKIIKRAKKTFAKKGFIETSLQEICEDAGVTTGAVYKRYSGKEALFAEVVRPAIEVIETYGKRTSDFYEQKAAENNFPQSWESAVPRTEHWLKALFKERGAVKILLTKADGTEYSNFVHNLVEESVYGSFTFMQKAEKQGLCKLKVTRKEYHALVTGYWASIFELFIHDFTWEEIKAFIPKIVECYRWDVFFNSELGMRNA